MIGTFSLILAMKIWKFNYDTGFLRYDGCVYHDRILTMGIRGEEVDITDHHISLVLQSICVQKGKIPGKTI